MVRYNWRKRALTRKNDFITRYLRERENRQKIEALYKLCQKKKEE